jgi:hypothetical protein
MRRDKGFFKNTLNLSLASRSPRVGSRAFMIFAVIHLARVLLGCSSLGSPIPLHGHRTTHHNLGGYCAQPPRFQSHSTQASPPFKRGRATRRGFRVGVVDSFEWGFVWVISYNTYIFIFQKSGLKPPTSVGKDPTVRRRRSKPLNPSTLVGGGSVNYLLCTGFI